MSDDTGMRDDWPAGSRAYFEYHCNRAHDSADAQLWYRSHSPVEVLDIDEPGFGDTIDQRLEDGEVRTYLVRFDDGHEGGVFEDELLADPRHFQPDMGPPTPQEIADAGCALTVSRLNQAPEGAIS